MLNYLLLTASRVRQKGIEMYEYKPMADKMIRTTYNYIEEKYGEKRAKFFINLIREAIITGQIPPGEKFLDTLEGYIEMIVGSDEIDKIVEEEGMDDVH